MKFNLSLLVGVTISTMFLTNCRPPETTDSKHKRNYFNASVEEYIDKLAKEKDDAKKAEITYNIALGYYKLKKYDLAAQWFENSDAVKYSEAHPEVILYLAESYKALGKYDQALAKFNEYAKRVPNDKKGINGAKSCELAIEWNKKPTRYEVTNVVMLNTPAEDAAPIYLNKKKYNEILFYSYRPGATGKTGSDILGQDQPDLYSATLDNKGKWSVPAQVAGEGVNTGNAEGASAIDLKGKVLYFTRCDFEPNKNTYCAIYQSKANGNKYDLPTKVTGITSADTINVFQPALNADATRLYFVSSGLPGGQGGYDIWYVSYSKETKMWENPTNLGPEINTPDDELFPYIHADGTLYFSSNGHMGIGGFDLFKAAPNQASFGPVVNLKVPLNSSNDDIAIVFEDKNERGYVTSNRVGTKGGLDIWAFTLHPIEVKCDGLVYQRSNNQPVAGAKVSVFNNKNEKQEFVTDSLGKFGFPLSLNDNFTLSAKSDLKYTDGNVLRRKKLKYFASGNVIVSTIGVDDSKIMACAIPLDTMPSVFELPNIVYEYDKDVLTPESQIILRTFVKEMMEPNPGLTVELGSHTDFRGGNDYNRKLAQRRAESAVRFLIANGVDASRLKAKGYGEDKPKVITADNAKFVPEKYRANFPIGTVLSEAYINGLKSKDLQEAAHQMNRRTEFMILCTEWTTGNTADYCNNK